MQTLPFLGFENVPDLVLLEDATVPHNARYTLLNIAYADQIPHGAVTRVPLVELSGIIFQEKPI